MKRCITTLLWVFLAAAGLGAAGWLAGAGRSAGASGVPPGLEEYPPGVRFVTVALGGFRGILADVLWLRAAQKQDEGDFFEVAQLSGWITRLAPRYPEVWSYHAWNIAYNIGAMFPAPEDRWAWAMRGMRLLRDEGIPANPHHSKLYWDLGWLYSDKISGRWEENPLDFRVRWAAEMTAVFGTWQVDAAADPDPACRARLAAAGLKPEILRQVDALHGPLDWRLPEAHAIYWAFQGRVYQDRDARWCDRLLWVSLAEMAEGGALHFDPARRLYFQGPRLDVARNGVRNIRRAGLLESPLTAVVAERFLGGAMVLLHAYGDAASAAAARTELAALPGARRVAAATEEAVLAELADRLQGVPPDRARQIVEGFLRRAELWRGLGNEPAAAGLVRLAELHRDALARVWEPREWAAFRAGWDGMVTEAGRHAAATLAGALP